MVTKKEKLREVYHGMKKRCQCTTSRSYKNYGARGIIVCEKWLNSFDCFYRWALKTGFRHGMSIDRIDVNGNYEPSNCRWASARTQANNKRNTQYLTISNVTYSVAQWAEKYCMSAATLARRLSTGIDPEQALSNPIKGS